MEQNTFNRNENSNGNGFKSEEKPTIQLLTCPECGYEGLEIKDKFCSACSHIFTQGQLIDRLSSRDVTLEKNKKLRKRGKKSRKNRYLPYLLGLTTVIVLGAIGIVGLKLNSNPYGHLKTAQGTISFGGEPCARRLVNLKVASVLHEINSDLKIRYLDNDRGKDQIQELIEGSVQIAFSEKAYLDSHFRRAKERGVGITAIPYAYDGIAFVTHKKTNVRPLSVSELEDIFEGKITNWKELGGADQIIKPILVSGKWANPNGLRLTQLNANTIFESDRAEAKEILKRTPGAIFYTSATLAQGELEELNVVSVENNDGTFVSPILSKGKTNQSAIALGKYPLARTLYVIVNSEVFNSSQKKIDLNQGIVKDFVDYLVSEKGQKIVSDAGFVPKYLSNR